MFYQNTSFVGTTPTTSDFLLLFFSRLGQFVDENFRFSFHEIFLRNQQVYFLLVWFIELGFLFANKLGH